jgi:hypothetical protein
MDIEQSENNEIKNEENIQVDIRRKKGRPKVITDVKERRKEYNRQKYVENKQEFIERSTGSQRRYREAYKLLVSIIEKNIEIPVDIKQQAIKIVSV